jgi:predicted GH43/DUF377 family glycosyl hydrolase
MSIIKRYDGNPVLSPGVAEWARDEARNPGVVFDGSEFHMVFTAASDIKEGGEMVLGYAKSADGFHFEPADSPLMVPSENFDDFDYGTVEDCRITEIDGEFFIAYAGRSLKIHDEMSGKKRVGPDGNKNPTWTENYRRVGLARTMDWKSVEKLGPITSEHFSDANVALFPEKINGKYAMLHRPTPFIPWLLPSLYSPVGIWICFSETIDNWYTDKRDMPWNMAGEDIPDDHLLIKPEYDWEEFKVGASGVPFATDEGWLMLYHAVDIKGVYRIGVLLLDRENPKKVIGRSKTPIMVPEADYELQGNYPGGCVFPCANILVGDEVFIYYGCADSHCAVATAKLADLLAAAGNGGGRHH